MLTSDSTDNIGGADPRDLPDAAPRGSGSRLVALDVDECLDLLASHPVRVGRIALVDNGQPVVLPVNYAYDRGTIVVRTHHGTKLTAALLQQRVAFEVDEVDPTWEEGWSVLVKGRFEEITDPDELAAMSRLPLRPWASGPAETGGERSRYVRVLPSAITGRRLV